MGPIFNYPKKKAEKYFLVSRKNWGQLFLKANIFLFILFSVFNLQAQIKVPNMMVPNDSWGLIDVNNLYGGCMQVDTHTKMLQTDVQFLKRGMLFVVYDDDAVAPGAQTKIYLFSPLLTGPKSWVFNNPFEIPSVKQNLNIASAGLSNYLIPLNISTNTDPGNKMNVYYDSTTNQFYKYDDTTDPATYVIITPKAEYISVVAQNGITSTNVQSALEELQAKIDDNGWKEYTIPSDAVQDIALLFDLKANSQVFINGTLIDSTQWSGIGTKNLKLLVATLTFDKIRVQR